MFTLPAITTKRVQTTVELQENQAFLQSGMITTEEGKSQAFLTVLEARLIAPEVANAVVTQGPFVEKTIDAGLVSKLAIDEGVNGVEATKMLKVMVDEAMNADRPLSVDATTIVANGELLTVRHPQALAARLEKTLQQIRSHGFAQSRLNVSIAILPEQTTTPLLQNYTMIGADAKVVEGAVDVQGGSSLLHANKMETHSVQFCRLTLRETGDFKHKISAMSNAALFHCRSDLVVLNGEQTAIKSQLNPALADLEDQLPGALLDVTVLPLKSRLLRLDLRIHAHNSTTMWSCDVTDDQVCVFRGPTRVRPTGERDTVLFIVSAKAAGKAPRSGLAIKEKVAYPDDPYAARRDQNAHNATPASNEQTSVGDSANAIRLHDDFGWSPAIRPRARPASSPVGC